MDNIKIQLEIVMITFLFGFISKNSSLYNERILLKLQTLLFPNKLKASLREERIFLPPKNYLRDYIEFELMKNPDNLRGLDIVRIQVEFNLNYAAVIERLKGIGAITSEHSKRLYEERQRYFSGTLFQMLNEDERLLKPANVLKIPARYLEYVISDYDNGYIPYSSLEKALSLINIDAVVFRKDNPPESEDISLDELSEEFKS